MGGRGTGKHEINSEGDTQQYTDTLLGFVVVSELMNK